MNKREAYGKLVKDAQKFYQDQDGSSFLMPLDETFGVCSEINLYTYWQGRGYAETTPEKKIHPVSDRTPARLVQDFHRLHVCSFLPLLIQLLVS